METFWVFRLRFRRAYDSAYDSDFRFSLGHKLSYDSDYDFDSDSVAGENQPLEAALFLVSTEWRSLVLNGFVNTTDWDQNQSDLSDLTLSMHRVTEVRESWTSGIGPGQRLRPEIVILGADQKLLKSKAHLNRGLKRL